MTLNQLLKEVYALGFDEDEGLNEDFVFSVNRALKMIYTELVASEKLKITIEAKDDKSFDIRRYANNVMFVMSAPLDSCGYIIKGGRVDGYTVTLPDTFVGEVFVYYKPSPKVLSIDHGEYALEIPEYITHLLPLLTAFFVFLDDDVEKAEYYMSLYRSEALKIARAYAFSQDNTYTDVTGWA